MADRTIVYALKICVLKLVLLKVRSELVLDRFKMGIELFDQLRFDPFV